MCVRACACVCVCVCVCVCIWCQPVPSCSSLSWNTYHAADIIAADYDGVLSMYDASTGQRVRSFQVSLLAISVTSACTSSQLQSPPLPSPSYPSTHLLICPSVLFRSMRRERGVSTSVPQTQTCLCQPQMTAEVSAWRPACQWHQQHPTPLYNTRISAHLSAVCCGVLPLLLAPLPPSLQHSEGVVEECPQLGGHSAQWGQPVCEQVPPNAGDCGGIRRGW